MRSTIALSVTYWVGIGIKELNAWLDAHYHRPAGASVAVIAGGVFVLGAVLTLLSRREPFTLAPVPEFWKRRFILGVFPVGAVVIALVAAGAVMAGLKVLIYFAFWLGIVMILDNVSRQQAPGGGAK